MIIQYCTTCMEPSEEVAMTPSSGDSAFTCQLEKISSSSMLRGVIGELEMIRSTRNCGPHGECLLE